MVRFFIDRPIFAWVIAIAVSLLGLLAILILPVDRYPQIAPPTITIRATYTGASSQTVETRSPRSSSSPSRAWTT